MKLRTTLLGLSFFAVAVQAGNIPYPAAWSGGSGDWFGLDWLPEPLDYVIELGIPIPYPTWPDNVRSSVAGLGFNYLVSIPYGSPRLDSSISIGTLALSTGAELRIRGGAEMELDGYSGYDGGFVYNDGEISIDEGGSLGAGLGPLAFEGSGSIFLEDSDSSVDASIIENGHGHLIRGRGKVQPLGLLDNRGSMVADFSGDDLKLDTIDIENSGEIRGTNGGRVVIDALSFSNDHLVEADAGSVKLTDSDAENDDVFRSRNNGYFQITDTSLDNRGGLLEALGNSTIDIRENSSLEGGFLHADDSSIIRLLEGAVTLKGAISNDGFLQESAASVNLSGLSLVNTPRSVVEISNTSPTVASGNLYLSGGWFRGGGAITSASLVTLDGAANGMLWDNLGLQISSGGSSAVERFQLWNSVTNNGRIVLTNTASMTVRTNSAVYGSGEIVFGGPGSGTPVQTLTGNGVFTNGAGHTIRGRVYVSKGSFDLVNSGNFIADYPSATQTILEFSNGRSITNRGAIWATNTAQLWFNQGKIENTGGFIGAAPGATIQFKGNPSLIGGTLGGGGEMDVVSASIFYGNNEPITIDDNTLMQIANGVSLDVLGIITNNGEIYLHNTACCNNGPLTALRANGRTSVLGHGQITFGSLEYLDDNRLTGAAADSVLVIGPEQTVVTRSSGSGSVATLVENYGAMGSSDNGTLSLLNTLFTNRGTVFARSGGITYVGSGSVAINIDNHGGIIDAQAGGLIDYGGSSAAVAGGTLKGAGEHRNLRYLILDGRNGAVTLQDCWLHALKNTETAILGELHMEGGEIGLETLGGDNGAHCYLTAVGDVPITGTGKIVFGPGNSYTTTTIRSGKVITSEGVSLVTTNSATGTILSLLDNSGTLEASVGTIVLGTNFVNRGTIRAVNGGEIDVGSLGLNVTATNEGVFETSSNGVINFVSNNGHNSFQTVSLSGGTFAGSGETVFSGLSTYLYGTPSPITINSTSLRLRGNTTVYASGTLNFENGTLILRDDTSGIPSWPATLDACGSLAMQGEGTVLFAQTGSHGDYISPCDANSWLTVGPQINMRGTFGATAYLRASLTNNGVIDTAGGSIYVAPPITVNNGLMRASGTNASVLHLGQPNVTVLMTNNGVIEAASNCIVQFDGSTVNTSGGVTLYGGTFRGEGEFVNVSYSTSLVGNTNPVMIDHTTLRIPGNSYVYASGTLKLNGGKLMLRDHVGGLGSHPATLYACGLTIDGEGQIIFASQNNNLANLISSCSGPLTIGKDVTTVCSPGSAGQFAVPLIHHGAMQVGAPLSFSTYIFTNEFDGRISGSNTMSFSAGASLINRGTISPGLPFGQLTVTGNIFNETNATHRIEIGGTNAASFGHLRVNGADTLAGKLSVALRSDYSPASNDFFTVVSATSLGGAFAKVNAPAPVPGFSWQVQYTNNSAVLRVVPGAATMTYSNWAELHSVGEPGEDFDLDGFSNLAEFVAGTDPNSAASFSRAVPELIEVDGETYFAIRMQRSLAASGVSFALNSSDDVGAENWAAIPCVLDKISDVDAETELIRLRDTRPISESQQRFVQLQFALQEDAIE
jgi:hypothetical protein